MSAGNAAKPTLVSLARQLGVSRQTVSNVLNAPEVVKPETRRRVLAAINAAGYRPSAAGRALRTQRSMNLAFRMYPAVDGINGAVMDRFLHNLVQAAQREGYRVTLFDSPSFDGEVAELIEEFQSGQIDACVLTNTHAGDGRPALLREAGIPLVAFGRPWGDPTASHAWLDIDGASGCAEAAAHLRRQGHTRIGFLGWPEGSGAGDDRQAGWLLAMGGLAVDGLWVRADDGVKNGAEAAESLVRAGASAIVCVSDSLALGAALTFRAHGVSGPVIGFDDTPVAAALGMSSVAQPVEEAASILVTLALGELSGQPATERQLLLPSTLITRSPERFTA